MVSPSNEAALQDAPIEEIEFDAAETEELDKLAEETRKCGISWEDLKAETENVRMAFMDAARAFQAHFKS